MISALELKNFLDTVQHMRRVQRAYCAKLHKDTLLEAKRLEAAVDVSLGILFEKLKSEEGDWLL